MILSQYLDNSYDLVMELEDKLCRIPAPSWKEQKRAAFIMDYLKDLGDTYIDEADNVVFTHFAKGEGKTVLICAHTDTVFPDMEPFVPYEKDGNYYCPGAGDDTMNVAQLLVLIRGLVETGAVNKCPVIFAFNSGEEGLGNLRGSRKLVEDHKHELGLFVSLDGGYNDICNGAVGSHRYKVTVTTPGGHSYGSFGNKNAIASLSKLICSLYETQVPGPARTTYNVGVIEGGTSVNTIAQSASMLYEYRSEDAACLEFMKKDFERKTAELDAEEDVSVEVEVVGIRPCAEQVDNELEMKATDMVRKAINAVLPSQEVPCGPSSTDCNIPLSVGIPAVAFGLHEGHGAHTREEYVSLASVMPGMMIGEEFLKNFFEIG